MTFIATHNAKAVGVIHACAHQDSINVGLSLYWRYLQSAQGLGVGRLLINAAENWSKEQGYRLLHLEVFANNDKAQRFYDNLGFEAETLQVVKVL